MKTLVLKSLLIILPLIFLVAGVNFKRTWYSGDPEYAYLLNGINIATFHSVGHTDNPGTPVQIYSAVVLRIAHFFNFSEKRDLQMAVLSDPDRYVELERKIHVVINAISMLFLGLISLLMLRNIWFSLILQITPFISANLLEHAFTKVSPEPFLVFVTMMMVVMVIRYYTDSTSGKKLYPWLFGLLAGFGLATKATFIPLAILPILLLKGKSARWTYLLSLVPFFILFTAPAIPAYPHMAKWFLGLSTHTGTYGQGSSGIIDIQAYFQSIPEIFSNNLAMSVSLLVAASLLGFLFISGKTRWTGMSLSVRFLLSTAVVMLLGILMVAKHYHANHYLVPCISLTGLLWLFIILSLKEHLPARVYTFLTPSVLALMILFGLMGRGYLAEAYHGYKITNEEYQDVKNRLDKEFAGHVKAYYYPTSINPYSALRWGSVYSRQIHLEALRSLYPEGIFFDIREHVFQLWESPIPVNELVSEYGNKILLVGGPMNDVEKEKVIRGGLAINTIYLGRTQAIYEVDIQASELFSGISSQPIWTITESAENASADNKYFINGDYRFENNGIQNAEVARTGKFSVKLPYKDSFGMAMVIDSAQAGQRYRFSAWRNEGDGTAFLVASAANDKSFYAQTADYLTTDENGWKKVTLDFTIPQEFTGGSLKLYLWNNGDSPVWFDDLSIARIN